MKIEAFKEGMQFAEKETCQNALNTDDVFRRAVHHLLTAILASRVEEASEISSFKAVRTAAWASDSTEQAAR